MYPYPKIETLWERSKENPKLVLPGRFRNPAVHLLADVKWDWYEKVDGTNIRLVFLPDSEYVISGRTDKAQIPAFLYQVLNAIAARIHPIMQELFPLGVVLYGEGYGNRIQAMGHRYRPDNGFVLFDILAKTVSGSWKWLETPDVFDVARKAEIEHVPLVRSGTLWELSDFIASGTMRSFWGNFLPEGIVARTNPSLLTLSQERVIVKLKHSDMGIKNE